MKKGECSKHLGLRLKYGNVPRSKDCWQP